MIAQADYAGAPFEASGTLAVESGAGWLVSLLTGSLALGLSVLAIAMVGLLMLSGRIPVRGGLQAVIGCFVLLGAPVIASALVTTGQDLALETRAPDVSAQITGSPRHLPPSAFDPYAGASLRQD